MLWRPGLPSCSPRFLGWIAALGMVFGMTDIQGAETPGKRRPTTSIVRRDARRGVASVPKKSLSTPKKKSLKTGSKKLRNKVGKTRKASAKKRVVKRPTRKRQPVRRVSPRRGTPSQQMVKRSPARPSVHSPPPSVAAANGIPSSSDVYQGSPNVPTLKKKRVIPVQTPGTPHGPRSIRLDMTKRE